MVKWVQEKLQPSAHRATCMLKRWKVLLDKGLHVGATVREKCPHSEFFWSMFSCIGTEYGETESIISENLSKAFDTIDLQLLMARLWA